MISWNILSTTTKIISYKYITPGIQTIQTRNVTGLGILFWIFDIHQSTKIFESIKKHTGIEGIHFILFLLLGLLNQKIICNYYGLTETYHIIEIFKEAHEIEEIYKIFQYHTHYAMCLSIQNKENSIYHIFFYYNTVESEKVTLMPTKLPFF